MLHEPKTNPHWHRKAAGLACGLSTYPYGVIVHTSDRGLDAAQIPALAEGWLEEFL